MRGSCAWVESPAHEGVERLDCAMAVVDEDLLKIMVCPVAHTPLVQSGDWLYSTDPETRRKYPIRDGIPIMLVDESEVADVEEFDRVMAEEKRQPVVREDKPTS